MQLPVYDWVPARLLSVFLVRPSGSCLAGEKGIQPTSRQKPETLSQTAVISREG